MDNLRGIKIATIRGIPLQLDLSLILLMIYVMVVSSAQLPFVAARAGIDPAALHWNALTWGFIFAIGLFASVVLHELGHSFVAQSAGVKVRSITLMMLGGVSAIDQIPDRPYFEFKLAVVGPLVSLVLGAILLWVRSVTGSPQLQFVCYWLGTANITLGIFNLLPAFPLDGGRALRSVLASRMGMVRGTQLAVRVSKVFAVLLGLMGFISINLLLMFIAFFIYATAQRELFFLLSKGLLQSTRVGEVAIQVDPLQETASLGLAARQMIVAKTTALPVLTSAGAPAVVTLAQIKRVPRELWGATSVRDIMSQVTRTLVESEAIGPLLPELASAPGGALPVQREGKLTGVVLYGQLAQLLELRSLEEPADERKKAA
jgi:Zn-dependent protease